MPSSESADAGGRPALSVRRDVALLFAGDVLSVLGTYFHLVAIVALAFSLSHRVWAMSLQLGAPALAGMLAAPWGGAWADGSRDRRRPMLLGDALGAAAALALAAARAPWEAAALAALGALGRALYGPARGGLMVQLVGRDRIAGTNGLRAVVVAAARLAGPLLAGVVVARLGVRPALALNAAGYAASALSTLGLRPRPRAPLRPAGAGSRATHARDARAWTMREPAVRGALVVWGWVLVGTWCVNTLWFVWVQTVHFGGPAVMGAAIAAYEGASIAAGALLVRRGAAAPPRAVVVLAAAVAACWCALALARSGLALVALSAVEGAGFWWLRWTVPTLIAQRAPEALLGGALAVEEQVDGAGHLAGVGLAAALGPGAPPPAGFLVAAAVVAVGFLVTAGGLRLRRRAPHPPGDEPRPPGRGIPKADAAARRGRRGSAPPGAPIGDLLHRIRVPHILCPLDLACVKRRVAGGPNVALSRGRYIRWQPPPGNGTGARPGRAPVRARGPHGMRRWRDERSAPRDHHGGSLPRHGPAPRWPAALTEPPLAAAADPDRPRHPRHAGRE